MSRERFKDNITPERLRDLLDYEPETGIFRWKVATGRTRPGKIAGTQNSDGYISICIDRYPYRAHRLAWAWVTGLWPAEDIDHINGQRSDNRFANLREATHWQNMHNMGARKRKDPSLPTGVTLKHGRYHARIRVDGQVMLLGSYETKDEASAAYQDAAKLYAGDFARQQAMKIALPKEPSAPMVDALIAEGEDMGFSISEHEAKRLASAILNAPLVEADKP